MVWTCIVLIGFGCNSSQQKHYFMDFQIKEMKNGDWQVVRRDLDTIITDNDSIAYVAAYTKYMIKSRSHSHVVQSHNIESFSFTLLDEEGHKILGNLPPDAMEQINNDVAHAVEGK